MTDHILLPRGASDLAQRLCQIEEMLETIAAQQLVIEQRLARIEAQARSDHYGVGRGGAATTPAPGPGQAPAYRDTQGDTPCP